MSLYIYNYYITLLYCNLHCIYKNYVVIYSIYMYLIIDNIIILFMHRLSVRLNSCRYVHNMFCVIYILPRFISLKRKPAIDRSVLKYIFRDLSCLCLILHSRAFIRIYMTKNYSSLAIWKVIERQLEKRRVKQ